MKLSEKQFSTVALLLVGLAVLAVWLGYKRKVKSERDAKAMASEIVSMRSEMIRLSQMSKTVSPAQGAEKSVVYAPGVGVKTNTYVAFPVVGRSQGVKGVWSYSLKNGRSVSIGDIVDGEILIRGTEHFVIMSDGLRVVEVWPREEKECTLYDRKEVPSSVSDVIASNNGKD